jgi:NAD(P) transhydrogenase subunit beta
LVQPLIDRFALHPAAGRMPGHMNFLLDEAEVPHAGVFDLTGINERFAGCDLALIIGANDVVNPAARDDVDHPNYGMPVLNADKARQVIVIKRGQGNGYSGIENPLFTRKNTRMIFGDARETLQNLLDEVKADQDSPPKS